MEMLSLYDYLNKAAGAELGKKVATAAAEQGVVIESKQIQNPTYEGKVLMYPREFLDKYFYPPAPKKETPKRPEPRVDDLPF
jgi:hypothetical protein